MSKEQRKKIDRRRLNRYQREAINLCLLLRKKGFDTYWVGGAVRDLVLGRENYDVDLATSAKPEQIKAALKKAGIKFYDVGEKFGTIGAQIKGGRVEITTFRKEGGYEDFRHPSKVRFIKDPHEDVLRRDFTANALLLDPETLGIIDYVRGLADIKTKTIRFVGESDKRIREDALRMMRAVRFATILGFRISSKDARAIKKHSKSIKKISAERIKTELDKIIADNNFVSGIKLLDKVGLLEEILPELDALKKVKQSTDFHAEGNAFIHTLHVIENLCGSDTEVRYAGLFHDLGKAITSQRKLRDGRPHISFPGHAQEGARLFSVIAKRLRFSRSQANKIKFLIERHMDALHPDQIQPKTVVKWAKNRHFLDFVRLRIADTLGSKMTDHKGMVVQREIRPLLSMLRFALKAKTIYEKNLLNGDEIMKILKLKQGKEVGEVLAKLKEAQVEGRVKTKKQAKNFVKTLDNRI